MAVGRGCVEQIPKNDHFITLMLLLDILNPIEQLIGGQIPEVAHQLADFGNILRVGRHVVPHEPDIALILLLKSHVVMLWEELTHDVLSVLS